MLLVVHRTFLTLVPDDSRDPPFARARSAPPALHYADSARRDVEASRRHSKPRKKKQAGGHGAAEDSDDSWYEEYTAIVAQEVAELPPEQPNDAATEPKRTKRRCRGGVRHEVPGRTQAPVGSVRIHILPTHAPDDPRPANSIFLLKEGFGEIGFTFDPNLDTSTLRSCLLGINDRAWDEGFAVATYEGRCIPIGSTLREQRVEPGARLRLARLADVDLG